MNAIVTPTIKYGLSCGLFESASKNLVIPIAELGPLSWDLFLKNLTIFPPSSLLYI